MLLRDSSKRYRLAVLLIETFARHDTSALKIEFHVYEGFNEPSETEYCQGLTPDKIRAVHLIHPEASILGLQYESSIITSQINKNDIVIQSKVPEMQKQFMLSANYDSYFVEKHDEESVIFRLEIKDDLRLVKNKVF